MGNRGCSWFITLNLCCPFLFSLLPCSSVEFLSWDTVLHGIAPTYPFLWGTVHHVQTVPVWAPFHRLQFLPSACSCVGSFPWAAASSVQQYPPAVDGAEMELDGTGFDMEVASGVFSQKPPLQVPTIITLPHKPNTNIH